MKVRSFSFRFVVPVRSGSPVCVCVCCIVCVVLCVCVFWRVAGSCGRRAEEACADQGRLGMYIRTDELILPMDPPLKELEQKGGQMVLGRYR